MYLTDTCDQLRSYYWSGRRGVITRVSATVVTEGMQYLTRSAKNYIFIVRTRTHTRITRVHMQGYYEYVPGRNIGQIAYSTQLLGHVLRMYRTSFFMFAPCINSIKTLFIIPTDAHNYKITGILKTIKIPIIAPTCFGSLRNHHQGAISCLAKTTIMIMLCWSLMTILRSVS